MGNANCFGQENAVQEEQESEPYARGISENLRLRRHQLPSSPACIWAPIAFASSVVSRPILSEARFAPDRQTFFAG
jgi:hypothetical protein